MTVISGFWGLCPQTLTGALPLDSAVRLPFPDPLYAPLNKILAIPLPLRAMNGNYDGMIHVRWRCGLLSNCFVIYVGRSIYGR